MLSSIERWPDIGCSILGGVDRIGRLRAAAISNCCTSPPSCSGCGAFVIVVQTGLTAGNQSARPADCPAWPVCIVDFRRIVRIDAALA